MTTSKDTKSMNEVYEWKELAAQEVDKLDLIDALETRIKVSIETVKKFNLKVVQSHKKSISSKISA